MTLKRITAKNHLCPGKENDSCRGRDGSDSSSDESVENGSSQRSKGVVTIPLHRLMLDYKERKAQLEKKKAQVIRRSKRPKRATQTYVAEPATYHSCSGGTKKPEEINSREEEEQINFYELVQEWQEEGEQSPVAVRKEALDIVKVVFNAMIAQSNKRGLLITPKKLSAKAEDVVASSPEYVGLKFPQQLMLLLVQGSAPERIWWLPGTSGKVFVIDLAFFVNSNMQKYFPGNGYKISYCLKRWGFQRSHYKFREEGFSTCSHPLFQRDHPELAGRISYPTPSTSREAGRWRRGKKTETGSKPNSWLQSGMHHSMVTSSTGTEEHVHRMTVTPDRSAEDKHRYPFLYPEESHATTSRQASAPVYRVKQPHMASHQGPSSLHGVQKATTMSRNYTKRAVETPRRNFGLSSSSNRYTDDSSSSNRYTDDASSSSELGDLIKQLARSKEEDRRLQGLIADQLTKASQTKRWSPLDVLATKEEIRHLTDERERMLKQIAYEEEALQKRRKLLQLKRQQASLEQQQEHLRINQQSAAQVQNEEMIRRRRLADALFGSSCSTSTTSSTLNQPYGSSAASASLSSTINCTVTHPSSTSDQPYGPSAASASLASAISRNYSQSRSVLGANATATLPILPRATLLVPIAQGQPSYSTFYNSSTTDGRSGSAGQMELNMDQLLLLQHLSRGR